MDTRLQTVLEEICVVLSDIDSVEDAIPDVSAASELERLRNKLQSLIISLAGMYVHVIKPRGVCAAECSGNSKGMDCLRINSVVYSQIIILVFSYVYS